MFPGSRARIIVEYSTSGVRILGDVELFYVNLSAFVPGGGGWGGGWKDTGNRRYDSSCPLNSGERGCRKSERSTPLRIITESLPNTFGLRSFRIRFNTRPYNDGARIE